MSAVWIAILAATGANVVIRATGPVLLGGRDLPPRARRVVVLLPAALLTALVMTQTFADRDQLVLDARAGGVAVALVALWLEAPMLLVLVAATAATAGLRAAGVG